MRRVALPRLSIFHSAFSNALDSLFVFAFALFGATRFGLAGTIHAFVLDTESQAVERVLVGVFDKYGGKFPDPEPKHTDSSGHAVFPNLADGIYMVGAVSAGVSYQPADNVQVYGASETNVVLRPVVSPFFDLFGRVLDTRGNVPVSNAVVTLMGGAIPIYDMEELMERHRTSQNGCFRYRHIYPGEYSIRIDALEQRGLYDFIIDEGGNVIQSDSFFPYSLELTAEKATGE